MAEENKSPISAAKPPVMSPISSGASPSGASTLKLKPVIRKPVPGAKPASPLAMGKPTIPGRPAMPGKPAASAAAPAAAPVASATPAADAAPEAPNAMEQLKTITQKIKGITQEIPQQAILHKTGIIADRSLTEAQKQSSKSRTSRISLSDAIGVSPVKNEASPMKTIRIKRPADMQSPTGDAPTAPTVAPAPAASAASAPAAAPAAPATTPAAAPAAPKAAATVPITQRKTLKINRPGAAAAPTVRAPAKPAAAKPAAADANAAVADIPDIADIPDMPAAAPAPNAAAKSIPDDRIPAVTGFFGVLGLLAQIAACVLVAFLGYRFLCEGKMPLRLGGCRPDAQQLSTSMWASQTIPVEAAEEPIEE